MELDKLLVKIEADLSDLKRGLDKANNQVKRSSKGMSNDMQRFGNMMDRVGKRVLTFGTLLAGAFGAYQIKQVVDVGRQIEDLQVRLKALFGTAEEGARAFDVMVKFAGKVPFSLADIQQASGNLAVVSKDANELAEVLEITGNVAGATGLSFTQTAEQIQRSFAGGIASADVFRERGVRSMLGFQAGAEVSVAETVEMFKEKFGQGGEFGNVTNDLANTLTGTLSMLQDKLFSFRKAIADEFMVAIKKEFGNLNQALEKSKDQIEAYGKAIGESLADAVSFLAKNIDEITTALKVLGVFLLSSAGKVVIAFFASLGTVSGALLGSLSLLAVFGDEVIATYSFLAKKLGIIDDETKKLTNNTTLLSSAFLENTKRLQKLQKGIEEANKKSKNIIVTEQELKAITEEVNESFQDAGEEISKAFGKSVTSGEKFGDAMKEVFRNLLAQIVQTITQILIIDPLLKSLRTSITGLQTSLPTALGGQGGGNGVAGAITGGIVQGLLTDRSVSQYVVDGHTATAVDYTGGGMSGMFSDLTSFLGFANGGYTPPNKPYMVGERGAEMFVPRTAGNVVANQDLGNNVTVNQSINFSTGVVPTVRAEVLNLLPAIKEETINAVAETRARGGAFARTFGA
jgi:hypothetical protein